jgi:TPR repeat protein
MNIRPLVSLLALAVMGISAAAVAQSERFDEALKAYEKQDYTTALYYWKQLADSGDGMSQYDLGILYYYGRGVPKDLPEAYKWFLLARDNHVAQAEDAVGRMEAILDAKDVNEGLRRRDEWHRAHGD